MSADATAVPRVRSRSQVARWQASVARHPRWWGLLLASLLLTSYVVAIRPARVWMAEHAVYPLLQQIETERARTFVVARIARRPEAVFVVPREAYTAATPSAADPVAVDRAATALIRALEPAQWAAPVGVIFLLPALFLIGVFPSRPYWAYLLAYHVVLGAVALGVFVVGVGWWEPAFKAYTFARTYMAETVSLVVPLLLALAARAEDRPGGPLG